MAEKYKIIEFELDKNNINKFDVADFERKIYSQHFNRILRGIRENKLLDNILTVIPNGDKYKIIDGQHRFNAFAYLIREKDQPKIKIVLRVILDKELIKNGKGREAYLTLDSGKPLTIRDIVKVYDDDSQIFFKKLARYCNHYGGSKKLTYADVLAGMNYMVTGSSHMRKSIVKDVLDNLDEELILKVSYVLENIFIISGNNTNNILFRSIILRNIFKLVYTFPELVIEQKKFQNLLKKFQKDSFINTILGTRTQEGFKQVFSYMCRLK